MSRSNASRSDLAGMSLPIQPKLSMMPLDHGGWSFYPLFAYPAAALLISAITIVGVRAISDHDITPRQALTIPFVTGVSEVVLLANSTQLPRFWLFVGTAVTIGASVALGIAVNRREIGYGVIALAIMIAGVLLGQLWSLTPVEGILVLSVSGSLIGFSLGYMAPT